MPFCINCGTEVASNAGFCFSCGATMQASDEAGGVPDGAGTEESSWDKPSLTPWEQGASQDESPAWGAEAESSPPAWGGAEESSGPSWGGQQPAWGASESPGPAASTESPAWPPSLSRQVPAGGGAIEAVPVQGAPPTAPPASGVPNYLVPSIFATLCCCLPGGLVSLIYASQANSKAGQGFHQEALKAANTARIFLIISVLFGLAAQGFMVLMTVLAALADQ